MVDPWNYGNSWWMSEWFGCLTESIQCWFMAAWNTSEQHMAPFPKECNPSRDSARNTISEINKPSPQFRVGDRWSASGRHLGTWDLKNRTFQTPGYWKQVVSLETWSGLRAWFGCSKGLLSRRRSAEGATLGELNCKPRKWTNAISHPSSKVH